MERLKNYENSRISKVFNKKKSNCIKFTIVDFVYKYKDKCFSSNLLFKLIISILQFKLLKWSIEDIQKLEAFDKIMKFLSSNEIKPSINLQKEYSNSELHKNLMFPDKQTLKNSINISTNSYNELRSRLLEKGDYNAYFSPDAQVETRTITLPSGEKWFAVGFFDDDNVSLYS